MPWHIDPLSVFFAKHLIDQIGILQSDLQQRPLSGCLVVGHGCFVEMPHIVEFVAVFEVRPACLSGVALQAERLFAMDGANGVEIAIFMLGSRNFCNQLVKIFFQDRIRM